MLANLDFFTFYSFLFVFCLKKIGLELRVVVLGRRKLLKEVKSVFNSPFFKDRVTFLQGSALNHHDLTRAQVARAQGVFILSCRSNTDDERNVLRVWAITNYSPSVPIYVYIYNSYYAQYIDNFVTSRICVHDLKQTILACNALHKGISTLITNLITPAIPLERYPSQWQVQYGDGTNNQIVELETRSFYIGLSFKEVAAFLFEVSNIILFAVRTITLNGSEHVLINPAEKYKLSGLENLICIAQNLEEIDKVNKMSEKEFQKVFSGKFQSYEHASNIIPLSPPPFLYEKKNHNSSNYDVMEPITFITTEGLVRAQPLNSYHGTKVPLCFIKLKPFATFQDVLLKQTRLSGHIVVFANTWELFWFFCTLRSIHIPISEQRPILIFTRNLPTKEEFKLLSVFPSFFILQGNFKQRHDLLMAQIHLAHSVVIFSSESTHPDSDGTDRSEFMDLDAIMLCHLIKKIINEMSSHPVQVVIELQAREALKYLSPTPRPQTDLRTSQIYPNEALTKKPQNSNTFYHPLYASGEGFISSMLDNLLFQDFFNPAILNIVNQLSGVRSAVDELYDKEFEVDPSNLSLIPLPKEFDKKSFRYLFHEFCMKYGIIPLGLYRAPSRSLENQEPFVYTGPFPETILRKTDEVFILTRGWGSLGPNSYSLNEKDE
ncbi:hypothetical protein HMI55_000866 [Coelomomyces lativittatus]|nr:hypothetical protein HMI55_000866 [Coelomomyces lativittatus]